MAEEKDTGLVSMRRPKKGQGKDEAMPAMAGPMREEYSYGLNLRLENFELDKLGMSMPKVGSSVRIEAVGKVTSVNESANGGERRDRAVQIQITELAVQKE